MKVLLKMHSEGNKFRHNEKIQYRTFNDNVPHQIISIVPDRVQHACGNTLSSGQAEHPDPADTTEGRFWDCGAAPGSVALHEVIFGHVLCSVWLLKNSVCLNGDGGKSDHMQ